MFNFFKRLTKSQNDLPSKIVGVLNSSRIASGTGGIGCEDGWHLIFRFDAWRETKGHIEKRRLRCLMPIERTQHSEYARKLAAAQIIELENYKFIDDNTLLCDSISNYAAKDSGLKSYVNEMNRPIVRTDDTFGRFEYDKGLDTFETKIKWRERPTILSLACRTPEDFEERLSSAKSFFKNQKTWESKISTSDIDSLLTLLNDVWRTEGTALYSKTDFRNNMTLESITFYDKGQFELWFDANDMFLGHGILMTGGLQNGIKSTEMC